MTSSKEAVRVVAYVDKNLIEALDKAAAAMEITRSSAIEACIESGLDDLKMFSFVGLTPPRIKTAAKVLHRIGVFKRGLLEFDFKKAIEKAGLI